MNKDKKPWHIQVRFTSRTLLILTWIFAICTCCCTGICTCCCIGICTGYRLASWSCRAGFSIGVCAATNCWPSHYSVYHLSNSTVIEFIIYWIHHLLNSTVIEFIIYWIYHLLNWSFIEFIIYWIDHLLNSSFIVFIIYWIYHLLKWSLLGICCLIDQLKNWSIVKRIYLLPYQSLEYHWHPQEGTPNNYICITKFKLIMFIHLIIFNSDLCL